eukprot:1155502-Pelagomonas_calceolata.AAC.1
MSAQELCNGIKRYNIECFAFRFSGATLVPWYIGTAAAMQPFPKHGPLFTKPRHRIQLAFFLNPNGLSFLSSSRG